MLLDHFPIKPLALVAAGICFSSIAYADVAAPTGEVILTVSGAISEDNTGNGTVEFDLEGLQALAVESFTTSTIWTEGEIEFTGVPMQAVMDAVGGKGATIHATAINDYQIQLPFEAVGETYPIIAYYMDGKTFSRRDKGPLWIVFPYDASPDFQNELTYGYSVWQLDRLDVIPE